MLKTESYPSKGKIIAVIVIMVLILVLVVGGILLGINFSGGETGGTPESTGSAQSSMNNLLENGQTKNDNNGFCKFVMKDVCVGKIFPSEKSSGFENMKNSVDATVNNEFLKKVPTAWFSYTSKPSLGDNRIFLDKNLTEQQTALVAKDFLSTAPVPGGHYVVAQVRDNGTKRELSGKIAPMADPVNITKRKEKVRDQSSHYRYAYFQKDFDRHVFV